MHDLDRTLFETTMHDLDRALFETYESETPQSEQSEFMSVLGEVLGESSSESPESEQSPELQEMQEIAVTSELLEVTSEAELDRFLGNLAKRAGAGMRDFARTPQGQKTTKVLKAVAEEVVPLAGAAAAEWLRPGWGPVGGAAATIAGSSLVSNWRGLARRTRSSR